MVFLIKKRKVYIILLVAIVFSLSFIFYKNKINNKKDLILGASLSKMELEEEAKEVMGVGMDLEKYFRPSNLPILNTSNETNNLINSYYDQSVDKISIPSYFFKSPEDTILNYFSVLREAANPVDKKYTGCGTLGMAKRPYKIAYNFFSENYKEKTAFRSYEDSFKNILHINLLKFKEVPSDSNSKKYFYEIETIEGSENGGGHFAYYYGYIYLVKSGDDYKIDGINITPEVYLCAPYHGWNYDAVASVEIRYGNWCNLFKSLERVEVEGYVKDVYFKGIDGRDYKVQFYILTNDYDIEVAQFVKNIDGQWESIKLNPEDCLDKNKKE